MTQDEHDTTRSASVRVGASAKPPLAIPNQRQLNAAVKRAEKAAAKLGRMLSRVAVGDVSMTFAPPASETASNRNEWDGDNGNHH